MNNDRIRYALIGAGAISQSYAMAFQRAKNCELIAVADSNPVAAKALSARTNTRCYTDIERLAEENGIDAVIVCTPPSTHEEISTFFLERGVHVLCEKPITLTRESLQRMLRASKASGAVLSMASKFRYVKDLIRAKQMVELGLLGEVVLFENAFMASVDMSKRWNSDVAISGGGVLIDNGTHSVDIMRYLLGGIERIRVVEGKRVRGLPVEETAHILLKGRSGILGRVDLSWSLQRNQSSFIDIHGSHGHMNIGWQESTYSLYSTNECVTFGPGYDKVQAFTSQLNNFSAAICNREPSLISEADIIASVDVIEAGYRSMRSGEWELVYTESGTSNFPKGDSREHSVLEAA